MKHNLIRELVDVLNGIIGKNKESRDKIITTFKKPGIKTFNSILLAISLGLIAGLIILLISNPPKAIPAFFMILSGPFNDVSLMIGIGDFLYFITPILLTGLSVGFAFKTGLFNIGASGQYMIAQFVAVTIGITGASLGIFHWFIALMAGVLAGAIWGFIPGFFKAIFNVNEVITSIMFNYIAMYLSFMIIRNSKVLYNGRSTTVRIADTAFTPKLFFENLFPGSRVDIGILIAILMAIVVMIILNRTTFGYELKACGYNKHASKYAGINEKRSIILSMVIAGALAGLSGALVILSRGASNLGNTINVSDEVLAPQGFNGIPVALLGLSHPIGIIFSAMFITYIQRGGYYMQKYPFKPEVIDIIIAVIIYFSAFSLMFRTVIARFINRRNSQKDLNEAKIDALQVEVPRIPHPQTVNKKEEKL